MTIIKWIGLWKHKTKHVGTDTITSLCGMLPGQNRDMVLSEDRFQENRVPCQHCERLLAKHLPTTLRKARQDIKAKSLTKCPTEPR